MKNLLMIIVTGYLGLTQILAQGYICAIGGGAEVQGGWSDAPYSWIVQKANYGKVVILTAVSENNSWLENYFKSFGASSVKILVIKSRTEANRTSNENEIKSAKAVFIKGGDQYNYISYWKDTRTEDAIRYVYQNGGVIAGTSAGACILSKFYFTARYGSVYPDETLRNPFNSYVDIGDDFLNLMSEDIIFDTHFIERGRWGRLIGFIFNLYYTKNKNVLGVGIDDATALCINSDLKAEVMGSGSVYFFYKDNLTQYILNGLQYKIDKLKCDILTAGWKYDLNQRQIYSAANSSRQFEQSDNIYNLNAEFILSGSDIIRKNQNAALTKFAEVANQKPTLIVYPTGYVSYADSISQFLIGKQIQNEKFEINSAIANLQSSADKIASYENFIFYGANFGAWNFGIDQNYLIAQAFAQKTRTSSKFLLIGTTGKVAGKYFVDNTDNSSSNSYKGLLTVKSGMNIFSPIIIQPRLYENSNFYENRSSAVLWGMMSQNKNLGIYLNDADYAYFNASDGKVYFYGTMPMLVVDASNSTIKDSSSTIVSGTKPRNSVALNNLRFFISNQNCDFDLTQRSSITKIENDIFKKALTYNRLEVYPNPFNPEFNIVITSEKEQEAKLQIYDQLGRKILNETNFSTKKGENVIKLNFENYPSGVYIILAKFSDGKYLTQKIIKAK